MEWVITKLTEFMSDTAAKTETAPFLPDWIKFDKQP